MYLVLSAIISPQQAVGRDNLSKPAGQWMKGKHKTKLDSELVGSLRKTLTLLFLFRGQKLEPRPRT